MEYRLDQNTGEMYSYEDYWNTWAQAIGEEGIIYNAWLTLPVIEVPEGKLEEIKEKMKYIHGEQLNYSTEHCGWNVWVKDPTKTLKLRG